MLPREEKGVSFHVSLAVRVGNLSQSTFAVFPSGHVGQDWVTCLYPIHERGRKSGSGHFLISVLGGELFQEERRDRRRQRLFGKHHFQTFLGVCTWRRDILSLSLPYWLNSVLLL